ncbi:uncharacterized protein K441DRAFT_279272 [Cenococcum geophilum 1.58]|uniref:uncharacterized protein n=1 Tax=Cenococcum geophilum 1.58 TaxID=794803 RepID=UPI00358EC8D6|nr:hypothetical protein K441DRAFT_279272 [Cenococcum geophilum 1.58]
MENQPICKNSKPPETNPHRNDSADQDSVAEITQWRRSRRHTRRRTARRPSVEIPGFLRREVLERNRMERMNDTTDTSNIQTNTCEPIPTKPRVDSVSSCPTEPSGLTGFPENENAVVARENTRKWTKERGRRYLRTQRKAFETELAYYDTMPVPDCMRVELERPTPRANTLKNLYKYYYRKIPRPGARRTYTKMMDSWLSVYRMRRLRRQIKEVWEDKDGEEDDEDLDDEDLDDEDLDDSAEED